MRVRITAIEIEAAVDSLARRVLQDYAGRRLLVIGVMTGGFMLLADLARRLTGDIEVATVKASSYRGQERGALRVDAFPDCAGRSVLLVDDVFDSGETLHELARQAMVAGASDVESLVLIEKMILRDIPVIAPKYVGYSIGDEFVVGYGMGHDDKYRHLPCVFVLEGDSDAI